MRKKPCLLIFPALMALSGGLEGAAVVSDDFGANRYGWNAADGIGAWTRHPNDAFANAGIISTNPLTPGGGAYLSLKVRPNGTTESPGPSPAGNFSVRKRASASAIDTTLPHSVSFDFRLDSSLETFTTFEDRFFIGASTDTNTSGTGATNTWSVGVVGAPGSTGITANYWYFHDRNTSDAINSSNIYLTAVPIVPGVVYSFIVTVDPATASFSANLTSSVGNASASNLGFRNGAVGGKGDLIFLGGSVSQPGEAFEISADNVLFIPEPGTAMLLAFFAGGWLARRRRA